MNNPSTLQKAFLLLCSIVFSISMSAQSIIYLPQGSSWKYYDLENKPANQGSNSWYSTNYNDNSWSSGTAHLGYGDDDEATVINEDAYTAYFRKRFTAGNVASFPMLKIDLTFDDGAIIYINGSEVARINMPNGAADYGTFTGVSSGDDALETFYVNNSLTNGNNTIAVEIHQKSAGSSDMSFDLKMSGAQGVAGPAAEITRGPYLQKGTSNSMVIKWRTEDESPSIVNYGLDSGFLPLNYTDETLTTEHEVELTGLSPNTIYHYDIGNSFSDITDLSQNLYFKTSPAVNSGQRMRAWVLGDCGTRDGKQRAVRDAFYNYNNGEHVDLMLFLGDNAYSDGTDYQYQFSLFEDMYEDQLKNSVAWSCVGNHDIDFGESQSQSGTYYDIFSFPKQGEAGGVASGTEAFYSFDHGNIHFVVLDSYDSDRTVGGVQYNWLESDLQNTTADWVVALWHHPPYCKGSFNSDNSSSATLMRENFVPLLESYGVDLVLGGHSHTYERSHLIHGHYEDSHTFNEDENFVGSNGDGDGQQDGDGAYQKTTSGTEAGKGAVYLISGTAGKRKSNPDLDHPTMAVGSDEFGSCLLDINGNQLNVTFILRDGVIEDYFTLQKDLATCIAGTPCNDNNECTINDILSADCGCEGTFQDGDNDGVCDADDLCSQLNDALIGTPCDDENPETENDVFVAATCNCQGTIPPPPPSGPCNITLTVVDNSIVIDGFSDTNRTLVKIYNSDWESAYKCNSDCELTPVIDNLPDDVYRVRVMELDENWNFICEVSEYLTIGSSNVNGGGFNLQGQDSELTEEEISEAEKAASFSVFPNPTSKFINIDLGGYVGESGKFELSNMLGEVVYQQEVAEVSYEPISLDISHFTAGTYTVSVKLEGRKEISRLVVFSRL